MTRAAFPDGVRAPVQYGPRLAAIVVYLQADHFLPGEAANLTRSSCPRFNSCWSVCKGTVLSARRTWERI